jgi:transcriptional regulator with XRE-family HTH domain
MTEPLAFADLLKLLFAHRTREDGTIYKAADVARATGVSQPYISLLMSGQRPNTSIEIARTLIRFFDVSLDILNATTEQEALEFIAERPKKPNASIKLHGRLADELSSRALSQIEELVLYIIAREKAEDEGEPLPPPPFAREE